MASNQDMRFGTSPGVGMQEAVKRAIHVMRTRYSEKLSLQDLASEALFSPFHFARMFRVETGIPPGRYLTAVRMFEAKRLLLTTALNVSDIVASVGYSSVGTFTTRFTRMVGVSPAQYRTPEVRDLLAAVSPDFQCLPRFEVARVAKELRQPVPGATGDIVGTIAAPPAAAPANVLIGVFNTIIPPCGPAASPVLTGVESSEFVIRRVPVGKWVIIAMGQRAECMSAPNSMFVGGFGQLVTVGPGRVARVDIRLRSPRLTDPPIAIAVASPRSLATLGVR